MKWNLKPVSVAKQLAATLSLVTMCASPLAQGAQAKEQQTQRDKMTQKERVSYFLRKSGLNTGKMTVSEFWTMFRPAYNEKTQRYMDQWVNAYPNELMPNVEATVVKGADGEQVRLLFSKGGKSFTASYTGNPDRPVRINGTTLTRDDVMKMNDFKGFLTKLKSKDATLNKIIDVDAPKRKITKDVVMTVKEFKKLTARQKAEYFIRLREAAMAAQKVFTAKYGKTAWQEIESKHQWAIQFLLGTPADAARASGLSGKPCIVAGWISIYGEQGSCGGTDSGARDLEAQMSASKASCSGGNSVPCNPMVYGFTSSGASHCIPRAPRETINNATALCNGKAPIDTPEQKKAIVESYMKKVKGQDINLQLVDGKISEEQYQQVAGFFDDLGMFVAKATEECEKDPLKSISDSSRKDQKSACDAIKERAFALEAFRNQPAPQPGGGNCDETMKNSQMMGGTCGCPDGTEEGQEGNKAACVAIGGDVNEGPVEKEKKKGLGIWPVVGILALVAGGIYLITRDKDKDKNPPVYVPPEPPVNPSPSPTVTVTPTDPEPNPCPPPKYINGAGACVEDIVLPPESEGGTTTSPDDKGGGVR